MSRDPQSRDPREREPAGSVAPIDDSVAQIVRRAGPRAVASDEMTRNVKAAVHSHWRGDVVKRSRGRRAWLGGLAAAAALAALIAGLGLFPQFGERSPVGRVETILGAAWKGPDQDRLPLDLEAFRTGTEMATDDDGAVALRLASGGSVRLAAGTRVRWESETALFLERGSVYVDSEGHAGSAIEVRTALGVAREIGTQFEVRVDAAAMRVRVREGRVVLAAGDGEHMGRAGDEMIWSSERGLAWGKVPAHGLPWDWTLALASPFELDGATLAELLAWISRETGWRVRYADETLERTYAKDVLHGPVEKFGPAQAPALLLPAFGLTHRLEDGVLVVEESR